MNREERIKALYGNKYKSPQNSLPKTEEEISISLPLSPDRLAYIDGGILVMEFPKNQQVISIVKRIAQRKYIEGDSFQIWEAPMTLDALDKINEAGFTLDKSIHEWKQDLFKPVIYNPNFKIPGIKHWDKWEEYQKQGVQFIEAKNGRALLADDPGLGKTLQILGWLQLRQDINPVLIILPANAKYTWYDEAMFWMDNPYFQIVSGTNETNIHADFVIINFDVLTTIQNKKDVIRKDIWDVNWQCIIVDEAHYANNPESIRGWAVDRLINRAPYTVLATATPGDKNKQKFTLCNLIDKRIFPSFYKFGHRYCDPKKNPFTGKFEFNGSSNELELNELLTSTIMLRRTKEDVYKNNPKVSRQVISLPIDNEDEYDEADKNFHSWLSHEKYNQNLTFDKVEKLTQLAVKGKMKAAIEWLWNLLESSKKIIVFCEHKNTVNALYQEFKEIAVYVDGTTSDKQKEYAKQAFQQCKRCKIKKEKHDHDSNACNEYQYDMAKRVFIGTRAAKESITLTAAFDIAFMEMWWIADDHIQAEGRPFGRKGDLHGGSAFYLIGHGTIEEHKAKVYDIKTNRNQKVMNGKALSKEEMLTEMIKSYRG